MFDKYFFLIVIMIMTKNAVSTTKTSKLELEQTPLYSFSKVQDPKIAKFLKTVESKFFKRQNNTSSFLASDAHLTHKRSQEFCSNPDQEYLERIFSEYQVFYRSFEEAVLKAKLDPTQDQTITTVQTSSNLDPSAAKDYTRFVDLTQCNPDERNMTSLNQQSICPWRYIITVKMDRYPAYRTEVKCTCDTCRVRDPKGLPRSIYGCIPVLRTVPVLIRNECGKDGFYDWKPSLDEINVACVCAFNHKYTPFTF